MAIALSESEYCPNCGSWITFLQFDYDSGWCSECTEDLAPPQPTCAHCESVLTLHDAHRSTCRLCRQEQWLDTHADELEFMVVVKGYAKSEARIIVARMVRPICNYCGQPIKGAKSGTALFCRTKRPCHSAANKYRRLLKSGLTPEAALATIRGQRKYQGR